MAPKKRKARGPWAKRLIELRKKRGLTQTELGKLVGVALSTWQQWESGLHKPGGSAALLLLPLLKKHEIEMYDARLRNN